MIDLADLDFVQLSLDATVQYELGRPGPQSWSIHVDVRDPEDEPRRIFWMDGWTFRLHEGSHLASELDGISADTAVFVPLVDGDDLSEQVVEHLGLVPLGDRLVLINHVRLEPKLRGLGGIGRYLTGLAIQELYGGASLVALHASPFELRQSFDDGAVPDAVWEKGADALRPVWESLGFEHFTGHLYALDPTTTSLDEAMKALHTRLKGEGA